MAMENFEACVRDRQRGLSPAFVSNMPKAQRGRR
jgi:hypothetical protein